ncbi:MAG: hypothetical protein M3516_09240 [Actinomycetota bacterium]|nr:hypothetical protein [Actinomycetota bacterium]
MDLFETSRREKRQSFVVAIALAVAVSLLAAPAVQAAIQRVKLAGGTATAKIKDTGGGTIDAKRVPPMGLFDAPGSSGAIAVRNFAGGGGFIGALDCGTSPAEPQAEFFVAQPGSIITGIILGGTDAKATIFSDAIAGGALPLMRLRANANHPNEFVGLGNGLTLTDALTVRCAGETGPDGDGQVILLGQ